jgi:formiminotetrahydrofolate cyclodeaminase
MTYELPKFTDEEILARTEAKAKRWEAQAVREPEDVAFWCRDRAKHLRVLMELFRLRRLDEAFEAASRGQVP